ncbi:MAG TPA: hypothetical protein VJ823_12375 [Rhodanobacteraceae bacterium]|nr:hypothetical protein [Rhodanobacteraceae bacterium]
MRNLDFSSWHALLSTLAGLSAITPMGMGRVDAHGLDDERHH